MRLKPCRDGGQQLLGIPAVIVGNGKDIAPRGAKTDVTGAGEPAFRSQVSNHEAGTKAQHGDQPVVGILVHHKNFKIAVALLLEADQQALKFCYAVESSDNE